MKILFVDCCIRPEGISRTKRLCEAFLKTVRETHLDFQLETLVLKEENLKPYLNDDVEKRNQIL